MKYGIVENHKFILIDDDLQRLKNPLPFMPQYSVEQIGTYDEDQIEQGHDGTWYEKGHAPQRPLEEARTEKEGIRRQNAKNNAQMDEKYFFIRSLPD